MAKIDCLKTGGFIDELYKVLLAAITLMMPTVPNVGISLMKKRGVYND